MNKSTKGAVAAGAAAVLLLGGAGTLAYWNAEGDIAGGTIQAGALTIEETGTPSWTLTHFDGRTQSGITDLSSITVVPGDTLTYAGDFTIGATGTNLVADVDVTGLEEATGGLAEFVELTESYTIGAGAVTQVTEANEGDTLSASIELDFPIGSTADNTSQTLSLDLEDVKVALTQVHQ